MKKPLSKKTITIGFALLAGMVIALYALATKTTTDKAPVADNASLVSNVECGDTTPIADEATDKTPTKALTNFVFKADDIYKTNAIPQVVEVDPVPGYVSAIRAAQKMKDEGAAEKAAAATEKAAAAAKEAAAAAKEAAAAAKEAVVQKNPATLVAEDDLL